MKQEKIIFALGFFDGIHVGHQALLTACRHMAERTGCRAGVVTFCSHPDGMVLGKAPALINTPMDRDRHLLGCGITELKDLPFDETLRNMPWQDFLEKLVADGAAGFVCGADFRFGFRGQGTAGTLADFCRARGLPWAVVPAQKMDGQVVSSTYIRQLLQDGQMERAVKFLGHPHTISGVVQKGRQLGRTIGIPTANLTIPEGVVVPKFGVYACKIYFDGQEYLAVTNIGTRPTVDGSGITVEPWILDFDGDLYGKWIEIHFYAFLRPERKFDSLDALRAEIQKNGEETRKLLGKS